MDPEAEQMAEAVGEKDGPHSLCPEFLHRVFVDDSSLDKMLEYNFFSQQVHVSPVDSWLHCLKDSHLSFIDCIVYYFLLICKFAIHWKSNGLVSTVSIPLSSHVMQDHLSLLNKFVILNIVQGRAVSAAGADGFEGQIFAPAVYCMFEVKQSMHLDLSQTRFAWLHHFDMSVCGDLTNITEQLDFLFSFYYPQVIYGRPQRFLVHFAGVLEIFVFWVNCRQFRVWVYSAVNEYFLRLWIL